MVDYFAKKVVAPLDATAAVTPPATQEATTRHLTLVIPDAPSGAYVPASDAPTVRTTPLKATPEGYAAVWKKAGLHPLAPWAVDYLVARNVSPSVALRRGISSGKGRLPATGSPDRTWSKAAHRWAESSEVFVSPMNTDGDWEDPLGLEGVEQEWLVLPAFPRGPKGDFVAQLRWHTPRSVQVKGENGWDAKKAKPVLTSVKNDWPSIDEDADLDLLDRALDFFHHTSTTGPLFIAEGTPKVDSLASMGVTGIVGIPGIQQALDGKSNEANPDNLRARVNRLLRERAALDGRDVILCVDADHRINPNVMKAVRAMCSAFAREGSRVWVLDVPTEWTDPLTHEEVDLTSKYGLGVGLDDYSAALAELAPGDRWFEALLSVAIPGENYIAFTNNQEATDVGAAKRLGKMAVKERTHFHVTEGENSTGKWWMYSGTHWTVDANAKSMKRLAIEATSWAFAPTKEGTAAMRDLLRRGSAITGAVDLSMTETGLARTGDIWEPLAWAEHFPAANGLVDLASATLLPHTPDALNLWASPVRYIPGATSAFWDNYRLNFFVKEHRDPATGISTWVHDPELEQMCQEYFGAMLAGRTYDAFMIWKGEGGCGMSTTIKAVTNVLGAYAGTMKAADMCGDGNQFVGSGIVHKRGFVSGEPNDGDRLDGALIKTLHQDGEDRDVEVKQKTPGATRNTANGIIPTNHDLGIAMSAEDNDAIRRRARIAYFTRKIPDEEKNGGVTNALAERETQEAILAWMVEGAKALIARNRQVYRSPDSVSAVTDWLAGKDRLSRFLAEYVETLQPGHEDFGKPGTYLTVEVLRAAYDKWCEDKFIDEEHRVSLYNFPGRVEKHLGKRMRLNTNGTGPRVWRNRRLLVTQGNAM